MTEYAGQQFVGIDLHRRRSVVVRMTESGEVLESVQILNDVDRLNSVVARCGEDPEVVLEATYGWYWAVDALQSAGAQVHLAHPLGVKAFEYRRVKNDVRDATDLADLLRMGRLPEAWIAPPATREVRELVRHRAKLVGLRSHCKAEIHAVLAKCGVQVLMSDLFSPAGEDLLDRCPLPGPYAARVQSLRRLIEDLEEEIDLFTRLARGRLVADPGYVALQQLPGIGPVPAAVFLAEVGDVTRFGTAAQLACWAGLTPKHHESDTHVHRGPITKQGSRLVRWAAVESVKRLGPTHVVGAYKKQVADRRGKNIGTVAAARKQTEFVFYALRDHHLTPTDRHPQRRRIRAVSALTFHHAKVNFHSTDEGVSMSGLSPGYAITVRVDTPVEAGATADLSSVVATEGGSVTALDVVESHHDRLVVDVTCDARDVAHAEAITAAIGGRDGFFVRKVSDRTFLMHLGGKIEVTPKVPLKHRDDLSRAYTPGVARVCVAIAENPADARRLTIKRNTVAVVTDGSAVLGLGNIGPAAALPVMEGKAALFKAFAGVDAWPVCLDTQDSDQIVEIVKAIAPVYGGINLEDIAAPRCFEIERRLRAELDIPVFHDDQHGTAIVTLAALTNALRVVGKRLEEIRVVVSGVGAAGSAIIALLRSEGARHIVACGRAGVLTRDAAEEDPTRRWIAQHTNADDVHGSLRDVLAGADVFIGVSAPDLLTGDDIATMADDAVVFALANPAPEVDPLEAQVHAAVVATGRSDYPNQINNVLAFPGVFRGLLDAGTHDITETMLIAAARAIADCVGPDELNASYIVPGVFDPDVAPAVAAAVRGAGRLPGGAVA